MFYPKTRKIIRAAFFINFPPATIPLFLNSEGTKDFIHIRKGSGSSRVLTDSFT